MKLLLDHNVSPRLPGLLSGPFPGSTHVSSVGLERATDIDVWEFARANGYAIVTKDGDFADLLVLRGFPPKLLWLRLGNCTTRQIEEAIRRNDVAIQALDADPHQGILTLV